MVYQPIVDHVSLRAVGHEALSRPKVDGMPVRPDEWFREAFTARRSVDADVWALTVAFADMQVYHELSSLMLFVNILPNTIVNHSFLHTLELLFRNGLCKPEQLVLELVEFIPFDDNLVTFSESLRNLRSFGIRIAFDDVGVGGASLRALVHLEPDFVKLDRSLVQGVSRSPAKQKLLSYFAAYMDWTDSVIAEGVEDAADLAVVQAAGISLSQGHYWSPPLPLSSLPNWHRKMGGSNSRRDL
ncbi:MAG: EAL domain-containing protein [Alicyclobacillus sp.]|nr:EAL domain-containing protein [Alicyclobacillus sp.]